MNRYGLIGYPLSHSFSSNYFARKFTDEKIGNAVYENFPLENIDLLPALLKSTPDLKGLNVTIPYKEQVIPFLHHSNDIVRETGACNCIRINGNKLSGFNTDVIGFQRSLEKKLKPSDHRALILGEGGAAKAVAYVLSKLKIEFSYAVRRGESTGNRIRFEGLTETIVRNHHLIINTTPVGMYPQLDEFPVLPYDAITSDHYLFDLIYNPAETIFLKKGKAKNARIENGYEMLVIQAEESWKIWQPNGEFF